ncbi:MAG: prolyl oligopeptidase family serine peptidase [Planctomycetota bacterium]|nr:prolyl oligopeptidase family serine peptidase [Planctomycetota bacterium]
MGQSLADESTLSYPESRRVDHVDSYHGKTVRDPYRWLEDDVRESKEVADWVAAQNKVTNTYLKTIPQREMIEQRLTKLWNYERYSSPFKVADKYYYFKNDGLQNQSVLYTVDKLDGDGKVVLDPNTWSEDGTKALSGLEFSKDGRFMAYGVADSGSDWNTWFIYDLKNQKKLKDKIEWVKFSGATWTPDSKGFFYGRFAKPSKDAKFQGLNLGQKIYYHRAGSSQDLDVLVYQRPDKPKWGFGVDISDDGRYLVLTVWKGTDSKHRVLCRDLAEQYGMAEDLIDNFDNDYQFIGSDGPIFFFKTDYKAPRSRVIAIDLRKPQKKNWREIVPQAKETLRSVDLVGNLLCCNYLKDAHSQVKMYTVSGQYIRDVQLPGIGTASGFGGRRTDTETFYTYSSFNRPPAIYRYNIITGESSLFRESKVSINPDDYVVEQVFYRSKDGTRVPMFLAYKKGLKKDGLNPTLLYGYGGFDIPLTPGFSVSRIAWMDLGGVLAVANLRGGGEYGEEWHKAGTKLQKQNVFDDFIAAAEWLVDKKFTQSSKLAVQGGSNGGLLVGAVMTQRPELFGACLPAVGVMDMLRFHKFTAGRFWVDDYGSSDNKEEFEALLAYSPYHNLKAGTEYPPTLVSTADTDDRVVPSHSFKFAAALQHAHKGSNPVLIRIETSAGHGAGTPTSKLIEEVADKWAFLVKTLGMDPK